MTTSLDLASAAINNCLNELLRLWLDALSCTCACIYSLVTNSDWSSLWDASVVCLVRVCYIVSALPNLMVALLFMSVVCCRVQTNLLIIP